jgi:hypothetical protein
MFLEFLTKVRKGLKAKQGTMEKLLAKSSFHIVSSSECAIVMTHSLVCSLDEQLNMRVLFLAIYRVL